MMGIENESMFEHLCIINFSRAQLNMHLFKYALFLPERVEHTFGLGFL